MYISVRLNRNSIKHEYNLKGNLIRREHTNIQRLWEVHQSEINGNTHFCLGVSTKQSTRSIHCKFDGVNFLP